MRITVLGTGLMGAPLARRLLQAGHPVSVYNRSRAKAEALAADGAQVMETPADALSAAEIVITMVTDAPALRETLLSEAARPHLQARTVIQMATIGPGESRALAQAVEDAGGDYLEAPVLGSIPEAAQGSLIVLAGGDTAIFNRVHGVLEAFGPSPRLIGPVGQGAAVKLALNQLIAALTTAFAFSLGMIQREGVEVERFMAILRESALYAPTFDKKLKRMVARHFDNPNFPTQHLLKDVELLRQEAQTQGLASEDLEAIRQLLERTVAQGLGQGDYSALIEAVAPRR